MEFDFSQPVESIDKVPEQFRPIYGQGTDGKFAIKDEFKGIGAAVIGLNNANKAARLDAETFKKKVVDLSPLAEFGADPATIKATFDQRVLELTTKGGDKAAAVEQVRKEMGTAHANALAAEQQKTNAYKGQLHTILVKNEALTSIAEAKGVAELLMPFIETQVRVAEADGQFTVQVVDAKGEPRYSNVTGQLMTIKELVATMKADAKYGRLFESDQQGGGGGGGTPPGSTRRQPTPQQGELSPNDKIAKGLASRFGGQQPRRGAA